MLGVAAAPCCGNCPSWLPPRPRSEKELAARQAAQMEPERGTCRRFPQAVPKGADQLCGEHPELRRQRDDELAGRIASAIVAAQRTAKGKG